MRYQITTPGESGNTLAFVAVEHCDDWNGFNVDIKPFIAEVSYGREKLMHRYNALTVISPYDYKIRVKRKDRDTFVWFPDNPRQAAKWYATQQAKFGLGCAAVTVNSRRKTITLHVTNTAVVEEVFSEA